MRGASFGLRQSLDTVGAFVGPAIAIALMWATANNFQAVFWVAVIPGVPVRRRVDVSSSREPAAQRPDGPVRFPLQPTQMVRLGAAFWLVVGVASLFTLARFSEAFLILRAQGLGLPIALAPMVLVVMNIVYAVSAYPAGALSDRFNRLHVLGVGFLLLIAADALLAYAPGLVVATFGVLLFGLHMGFTQGIFATLVADCAPPDLRGTAFRPVQPAVGLAPARRQRRCGRLWDPSVAGRRSSQAALFAAAALAGSIVLHRAAPADRQGHAG